MFPFDATGIDGTGGFEPLPKGEYNFQIKNVEEKVTDKMRHIVKVTCEVIDNDEYSGKLVFHHVTFIPKGEPGSGMAIYFLATIQEPFEGTIEVEPLNWIAKRFKASVIIDEYKGKKNNKIAGVDLYEGYKDGVKSKTNEDVPF